MKKCTLLTFVLAAALALAPLAAVADSHDQMSPITWLNYLKAQTGQGGALGAYIAENGAEIYDPMMAEGHVITWGVGQPINHRTDDDWTHLEWVTFRDWAAADVFMDRFMADMMSKTPEEMAAEGEKWYSLVVPGSHYDEIVRHQVLYPGEARPRYFTLAYYTAKAEEYGNVQPMFEDKAVPVLSALQASGAVTAFGMAVPEVHDGGSQVTHLVWYGMANLATRDAALAAFTAAEESDPGLMANWAAMFEEGSHHDRIVMVTHYGGGGGEGGGDG